MDYTWSICQSRISTERRPPQETAQARRDYGPNGNAIRRTPEDARVSTERAADAVADVTPPPRNVWPATFRAPGVARVAPSTCSVREEDISVLRTNTSSRDVPPGRGAIFHAIFNSDLSLSLSRTGAHGSSLGDRSDVQTGRFLSYLFPWALRSQLNSSRS